MSDEIFIHFGNICPVIVVISTGDSNTESQVLTLVMQNDSDEIAGTQHPLICRLFRFVLGVPCEKLPVNKGAIGRLILNHDIAVLINIDPEMNITNATQGVIDKDHITPSAVSAKGKSRRRVLDLGRKPQDDSIVAMASRMRLEAARVVLQFIVRFNIICLVFANNILRVLLGQPLDLLSCRIGVRIQNAYDVGYVFIREARVLLPYSSRIEDILGR